MAIIAHFFLNIQKNFQMGFRSNLSHQFCLGPPELLGSSKIPFTKLHSQVRFHNHDILCPAKLHGSGQQSGIIFIGTVEVTNSAEASGRETLHIRVMLVQVLRSHHSGTLFHSPAYRLADLPVQFHLRKLLAHQFVKCFVHFGVINVLSDVHGIPSFIFVFSCCSNGAWSWWIMPSCYSKLYV